MVEHSWHGWFLQTDSHGWSRPGQRDFQTKLFRAEAKNKEFNIVNPQGHVTYWLSMFSHPLVFSALLHETEFKQVQIFTIQHDLVQTQEPKKEIWTWFKVTRAFLSQSGSLRLLPFLLVQSFTTLSSPLQFSSWRISKT